MFEQDLSANYRRKNNPLFKVALQPADAVWQGHDGTNHSMPGVATAIGGVQFSKSEQFVTYPNGSVQQENVYWDTALQIYYWECQADSKWYFEDPYNDDAITKAGSYKKLLRQLEHRQFWWLETDEDVSVTQNPDGSKCYAYKGLHDPAQITVLLEEEAEQAQIAAEQPVSKWKAVALSAMTLLGNAMGFQSLAKSYVSEPAPNQSEPPRVDKPSDTKQSLSENSSAKYKQSARTESAHGLSQYPFTSIEYQPRVIVNALQFFSAMATGVASIIHPRPGREQKMLNFPNLLTLLTGVQSADGTMSVEANKKAFSPEATGDLVDTETFTHVFNIPALADDLRLLIPNQGMQRWPTQSMNVLDNSPVASHTSDSAIATSLMSATPLDIPIVYLPEHTQSEQTNSIQETINPLQGQLAQLSLSKHLPVVDAQSRQTSALSSTPSRELNALSDAIKIATHTAEIERCIREAQEKVIANDEKSTKEKGYTVQVLDNLVLALSKTSELLMEIEAFPNYAEEVGLHEATILVDALVEARGYLSTQIANLGLDFFTHLNSKPTVNESFLSSISEKVGEIDSKTIKAIVGGSIGGGALLVLLGLAAINMIRIDRDYKRRQLSSVAQKEDGKDSSTIPLFSSTAVEQEEKGSVKKDSKKSRVDSGASLSPLSPLEQLKTNNPGVNFQTCKELLLKEDVGVKVYFFYGFYGTHKAEKLVEEEFLVSALDLSKSLNIGKGVIYFGGKSDMEEWVEALRDSVQYPDQYAIDSRLLAKKIKLVSPQTGRQWNYERNAAYWCGGMSAKRIFKNFNAFPNEEGKPTFTDFDGRFKHEQAVEGDELLWLKDNEYLVYFDNEINRYAENPGPTLMLSPQSAAVSSISRSKHVPLENLHIGYYNTFRTQELYSTEDRSSSFVEKTRAERIDALQTEVEKMYPKR